MKALTLALGLFLVGCSSAPLKKAYLPSNADPQIEFTQLEDEMRQGYSEQLALLSPEAFSQANHYLKEAKNRLQSRSDRKDVLESIAYAKGALETAFDRALRVSALLGQAADARRKAVEAGAENYAKSEFKKLDREVMHLARQLEQGNNQATLSSIADRGEFQKRYSEIELQSLYLRFLGEAREDADQLRSKGAARKASKSFARFESKLRVAESSIAADRYNQTLLQHTQNELKTLAQDVREEMSGEKRIPASEN